MVLAPRRTAAAVLSAATLLAFATPAAHAQNLTISDGAGDVWVAGIDNDGFAPAPGSKHADVRRIVVKHAAKKIVVRAKLTELTRQGALVGLLGQFRTNTGLRRDATLFGEVDKRKGRTEFTTRRGRQLDCAMTHKIGYTRNTMTMGVPRSCLKNPRWVEFRSQNAWITDDNAEVYVDNPHNDKPQFRGWSSRIRRG